MSVKTHSIPPVDNTGKRRIDTAALDKLEAYIKGLPSTKSMHVNKHGIYSDERIALHNKIIEEEVSGNACITQGKPIAILTGGLPGSGKSTFIKNHTDWMQSDKLFKIDADEIRAKLPEYEGWNASQTHEETQDITRRLLRKVGIGGCSYDILYDGTMNKVRKYDELIDMLRAEGYDIYILFMHVPKDVSMSRAMGRYQRSGRYVPRFVIEEGAKAGLSAFNRLKKKVDGYVLVDGITQEVLERGGRDIPGERDLQSLSNRESYIRYKKNPKYRTNDDDDFLSSPAALQERQNLFTDTVALYEIAKEKGKIPASMIPAIDQQFKHLASLIALNYPLQEEKTAAKEVATGDAIQDDVNLTEKAPIAMTKGERKKANLAALAVLEKNDSEITTADIETLRNYTGAGGIGYVSEDHKEGLLNEHYTSYPIVQFMWDKLKKMGVKHGNYLEPGAGIGNFAGLRPKGVNMVMLEKSPISSRIASILYPNQETIFQNFADTDLSIYNLTGAIGNVPFGDIRIHSNRDKFAPLAPSIHNYFILKSLDAVKPASPVFIITSTGTMDAKNSRLREEMMKIGRFITAYRLPADSFKDNASTTVTTDVILFQKYPKNTSPVINEDFLNTVSISGEFFGKEYTANFNQFYQKNPKNVLGEHLQGYGQQFPGQMGVKGKFTEAMRNRAISDKVSFPYALPDEMPVYRTDIGKIIRTKRTYHSGSIVFHENKFWEKERNTYQQITVPKADRERLQSALVLLDTYADFVSALSKKQDTTEPLRAQFRAAMDKHIERFGLPEEDQALKTILRYDTRLFKLTAFVKRNPETNLLDYADIFSMQTMYQNEYTPSIKDANDLTQVTMYLKAKGSDLSIDDYQSVYKGGVAEAGKVEAALKSHPDFYFNPETQVYEYRYEYLSGDVRKKLQRAEDAGLQKNVEALRKVIPSEVTVYEMEITPQAALTWLPITIIEEFLAHKIGVRGTANVREQDNITSLTKQVEKKISFKFDRWAKNNYRNRDNEMGWGFQPYSKILEIFIKGGTFPLYFADKEGNKQKWITLETANKEETTAAKELQRINTNRMRTQIARDFMNWLRLDADNDTQKQVEALYNDQFNAFSNPKFDGSTFRVSGMSNSFYGKENFTVFRHNLMVAEKLAYHQTQN